MRTLPFLYLPDAVTLILLLVILIMLRKVAIAHIRQELMILHEEMLLYWLNNALDLKDPGYTGLCNLVDSCIRLAPRFSPGRLLFIFRLDRKMKREAVLQLLPDPSREVSRLIESTPNANGREMLRRLQLEMNMGLGVFFIMGSLSGWFLFFCIVPRVFKRTVSGRRRFRIDYFFNMMERVLTDLGRKAQQIGLAGQPILTQPELTGGENNLDS